ncbi:hypothetical protein L2E82_45915 [Cichorium intybus]|uniref:Uncharacterized protein n=1 Tax=Cichorium intybus TaxID=13427 RepID=A0ACB8ZTE5_CICIN|nr:hypothetical protein L2E82_45915 [Cichorium intybus]
MTHSLSDISILTSILDAGVISSPSSATVTPPTAVAPLIIPISSCSPLPSFTPPTDLFPPSFSLTQGSLDFTASVKNNSSRGVRYHLKEYSTRAPENSKELFNLRHASLRNAIERAFGVLKKRFPIIRKEDRDKALKEEVIVSKQEAFANTFKKEQLKWTEKMDSAFVQAMIKQQDKGNRIKGTFTTQAYADMTEELSAILQMNITKNHLKNRLKTLKTAFSQWYDLFQGTSMSGFSWNANTRLIEAEDEIWDNLIKSKPDAIMLKTKKVSNYNEMLDLFSTDRAKGEDAETAKEINARLNKIDNIKLEKISEVDDLLASNEVTLENPYNLDDDDIQVVYPTPLSPEQHSSAKKCKSKKRKVQKKVESSDSNIVNAVHNVAQAIMEGNKIMDRAYPREYTGEEIFQQLDLMGLELNEIPRALNFLATNQAKLRLLFSTPLQIRMGVLKDMMGTWD